MGDLMLTKSDAELGGCCTVFNNHGCITRQSAAVQTQGFTNGLSAALFGLASVSGI